MHCTRLAYGHDKKPFIQWILTKTEGFLAIILMPHIQVPIDVLFVSINEMVL